MKFHFLIFCTLISVLFHLAGCHGGQEPHTMAQEDTAAISAVKAEISAFWKTYREAQKFRVEGDWSEAAKYYKKALEINPAHEDTWFNLGNMYLELNESLLAASCWQKIVADNPQSARAHMQLGRLYLSYERPEIFDINKAEQEFTIASRINIIITAPLMHLGYIALIKSKDADAKNYFQSVIGTDIKNVEAYFLLGYLDWKEHNYVKSQQFFKQAISFHTPVKARDGTLSEGDTKDGVSFRRPINQSIFYEYFQNLEDLPDEGLSEVLSDRYQRLQKKIDDINSRL